MSGSLHNVPYATCHRAPRSSLRPKTLPLFPIAFPRKISAAMLLLVCSHPASMCFSASLQCLLLSLVPLIQIDHAAIDGVDGELSALVCVWNRRLARICIYSASI